MDTRQQINLPIYIIFDIRAVESFFIYNFNFDLSGEKGNQGEQGSQGFKGERGNDGPEGPTGPQGFKGSEGRRGLRWIIYLNTNIILNT